MPTMASLSVKEYFFNFRSIGRFINFVRSQHRFGESKPNWNAADFEDKPHRDDVSSDPDDEEQRKSPIHPYEFRDVSQYQPLSEKRMKKGPSELKKMLEPRSFKLWIISKMNKRVLRQQSYDPEHVEMVGADLACSYIFVTSGGAIKFLGEDHFLRAKSRFDSYSLPVDKNEKFKIEAIDASKIPLVYEALRNLKDLKYLRWISFSGCVNFDNWFLDYLSAMAPNIEYLDLSHCPKIDHNGLSCIYRFRKLKCLNVEGISNNDVFKFACLSLESENPNLAIVGIPLMSKPKPKSVFDDN